jgi:hypothetical protein
MPHRPLGAVYWLFAGHAKTCIVEDDKLRLPQNARRGEEYRTLRPTLPAFKLKRRDS